MTSPGERSDASRICKLAEIDDELAVAIEQSYGDLTTYRTHPEVVDVITTPHCHDIEIAIVSDFHVDLRPYFASLGILDYIWVRDLLRSRGGET